ncbi:MAG: hypothetical protein EBR34_08595 [Sphingomonadaceae bacterium]|nr:hypothetical protein [Sphingomonadaceae bacterium]
MDIRHIAFAIGAFSLSACATVDPSTLAIPVAVSLDEHAEFSSLAVVKKADGVQVSGWVKPKRLFGSGMIHVEALSGGIAVAAADVPWRSRSHTRLRRHSSASYFRAKLPVEALAADSIQISHVQKDHLHRPSEAGTK